MKDVTPETITLTDVITMEESMMTPHVLRGTRAIRQCITRDVAGMGLSYAEVIQAMVLAIPAIIALCEERADAVDALEKVRGTIGKDCFKTTMLMWKDAFDNTPLPIEAFDA